MEKAVANNFKVRLISVLNDVAQTGSTQFRGQEVVFENTPAFSESGGVEYTPVQPIHMPGAVQIYKNTQPRTFTIGARLVGRTRSEVTKNSIDLQLLRSWRYPFFGRGSSTLDASQNETRRLQQELSNNETRARQLAAQNQENLSDEEAANFATQRARLEGLSTGFELLGAPPEVLYLYAYSATNTDRSSTAFVNINRIPVVLTNLDITWPDDVDYIPTLWGEPFPVKMDVSIALAETHSPKEFEQFSLAKFKVGQLDYF
jgi:hypothetical protein